MRDTIGDLWNQTCIASPFGYDILCVLTLITRKLQVVCGRFTHQTTSLLSQMYIFCVRAGCEIRMAIYASKHASESPSYKPFVITYTHNLKSTGPIRTFCISNDSSSLQRHSLWELELHERFHWRDTALGTHRSFLHRTLCMYTESPYMFHPDRELWPVPEQVDQFVNRLSCSGTGVGGWLDPRSFGPPLVLGI